MYVHTKLIYIKGQYVYKNTFRSTNVSSYKANIMTLVFWQCICMHLKSHITALNLLSYKYKKCCS